MIETFIESLCGNHAIYTDILYWLKDFDYDCRISEKSCIILSGPSCVGKTYSIKHICKYLDYYMTIIDHSTCINISQLKDIIFKTTSSSLIQVFTGAPSKKVIIIDNFDAMFVADKTICSGLLKLLAENKIKNIPIVCITNNDIIKKMGDIRKYCKVFEVNVPTQDDVMHLFLDKNIIIKHIKDIYAKSHGNMQRFFEMINDANHTKINKEYNNDIHTDVNILYNYYLSRHLIRRTLDTDTWLIPLRFHENIILELNNRKIPMYKKKDYYKLFMDIICLYDLFMSKNNVETAVDLFASAIYSLSLLHYKKQEQINIGNFTKILSYLSLQKKGIKRSYNSNFPLYQLSNYHVNLYSRKFISL